MLMAAALLKRGRAWKGPRPSVQLLMPRTSRLTSLYLKSLNPITFKTMAETCTCQDEDYEIMQFAIQQSLQESSRSKDLSGPASNGGVSHAHSYEAQYERAIQESLLTNMEGRCPGGLSDSSRFDSDLRLAMELSAKELAEQELRLQEEEAELQQVLQLSLTEK